MVLIPLLSKEQSQAGAVPGERVCSGHGDSSTTQSPGRTKCPGAAREALQKEANDSGPELVGTQELLSCEGDPSAAVY